MLKEGACVAGDGMKNNLEGGVKKQNSLLKAQFCRSRPFYLIPAASH